MASHADSTGSVEDESVIVEARAEFRPEIVTFRISSFSKESAFFRTWPQRWGTEAADKSWKRRHRPTMTSSRE
jgi:hypothetical protein